jgi:hypothetical protein
LAIVGAFLAGCGGSDPESSTVTRTSSGAAAVEHAVIVHLATSGAEPRDVFALEDKLIAAIENADAGEFDGNEIAVDGSEVVLYAYGPNADRLYAAMEPVIKGIPPARGSYVIKRYGDADDANAKEVRIDLSRGTAVAYGRDRGLHRGRRS